MAVGQASPGTYVVMSQDYARTAFVQVTGTVKTRMREGLPETYLANVVGTPVNSSGGPVASDDEFDQLDGVMFGASRTTTITGVVVPSNYAASFIGSLEEEVVPGIGQGVVAKGINPGSIPVGTVITVTFSDGTTAQYVKASNFSTYQWVWNGVAHDAQGRRIDRSGAPVGNSNRGDNGGGEGRNVRNGNTFYIRGAGIGTCGAAVNRAEYSGELRL